MKKQIIICICVALLSVPFCFFKYQDFSYAKDIEKMPDLWEQNEASFEDMISYLLDIEGLAVIDQEIEEAEMYSDTRLFEGLRFRGKFGNNEAEHIAMTYRSLEEKLHIQSVFKTSEGYVAFQWKGYWWTTLFWVYDPRENNLDRDYEPIQQLSPCWYIAKSKFR